MNHHEEHIEHIEQIVHEIIVPEPEPIVVKPTPAPTPVKPKRHHLKKLFGQNEQGAFKTQNRIRKNPEVFVEPIKEQIDRFRPGGRLIKQADGIDLMTNEGISAWKEAKEAFESQSSIAELEWSDQLALAAEDHCRDMGP